MNALTLGNVWVGYASAGIQTINWWNQNRARRTILATLKRACHALTTLADFLIFMGQVIAAMLLAQHLVSLLINQ